MLKTCYIGFEGVDDESAMRLRLYELKIRMRNNAALTHIVVYDLDGTKIACLEYIFRLIARWLCDPLSLVFSQCHFDSQNFSETQVLLWMYETFSTRRLKQVEFKDCTCSKDGKPIPLESSNVVTDILSFQNNLYGRVVCRLDASGILKSAYILDASDMSDENHDTPAEKKTKAALVRLSKQGRLSSTEWGLINRIQYAISGVQRTPVARSGLYGPVLPPMDNLPPSIDHALQYIFDNVHQLSLRAHEEIVTTVFGLSDTFIDSWADPLPPDANSNSADSTQSAETPTPLVKINPLTRYGTFNLDTTDPKKDEKTRFQCCISGCVLS